MLEKLMFKNHMGETIDFGEGGLYVNCNELHSYKWNYSAKNNRISYFSRDVKEKKIPVVIVPPHNRSEGNNIMNRLMELGDRDVLSKQPGRITIGDYYLDCYLFANEKSQYDLRLGVFYADLTVVTDKPAWIKETTQIFNDDTQGADFLDYEYDYPYDFTSPGKLQRLTNLGFYDSDFKMVIYGEVTNPTIYIGGHEYSVTGHIGSREYLEIDSREKTVYKVDNYGNKTNYFSRRNKNSYIFQKIPAGVSSVSWQGTYRFDVTLFEERSEPKWT